MTDAFDLDPQHLAHMRHALAQGRKALPACLPNPPVGCVLVRDNEVISEGFTQPPGLHHAEAMALDRLTGNASGITAYVSLEPCSFHGRTPSCAHALVQAGVERVFVAMLDPDPRNAGAGIQILRDAGVEVVLGVLAKEASRDLSPFLLRSSVMSRSVSVLSQS